MLFRSDSDYPNLNPVDKVSLKVRTIDLKIRSHFIRDGTFSNKNETYLVNLIGTSGNDAVEIKQILELGKKFQSSKTYVNKEIDIYREGSHFNPKVKREIVVLIPKAINFGDEAPQEIKSYEYAKSLMCYKVDPDKVIEYFDEHKLDTPITMSKLKEVLIVIGLPINSYEQKVKYLEMMENLEEQEKRHREIGRAHV